MTFAEFRDGGFLQEANRQWFHPRGLALAANESEDGAVILVVLVDDDPDGWQFDWSGLDAAEVLLKAKRVADSSRDEVRRQALGWVVQPLPVARVGDVLIPPSANCPACCGWQPMGQAEPAKPSTRCPTCGDPRQ